MGDLVDTLKSTGPFTVFAPTNDAFGKLDANLLTTLLKPENKAKLAAVLTYHVTNGKVASSDLTDGQQITTVQGEDVRVTIDTNGVFINTDSQVVTPDVEATNGIVHIINKVLVPPNLVLPVYQNIVELAQATGDLSTLVQAVVAADLVATLTSAGPFTVFAPTNDAFGALPAGLLDTLLKPENKARLAAVLTYHIANGEVTSSQIQADQATILKTLETQDVTITISENGVFVNSNSQVVVPDVKATNGIVHIINNLLIPPGFVSPDTVRTTESPVVVVSDDETDTGMIQQFSSLAVIILTAMPL